MRPRHIILAGCTLIALVLVIGGGRLLVFLQIKKAIVSEVETLRLAGTGITYTSLEVNSWKGSLSLMGISINSSNPDSLCQSRYSVSEVWVEGIHILPLLLRRELIIESVIIRKPSFHLTKHLRSPKKSAGDGHSLTAYEIKRLTVDSGRFELLSDVCKQALTVELSLLFTNLRITNQDDDSLRWQVSTAVAKEVQIASPEDLYIIRGQSVTYNSDQQTLQIDSMSMEPSLERAEFAKHARYQIDQISCQVPFLKFNGLKIAQSNPLSVSATGAEFAFTARVFRDKRFPAAPRTFSSLPIQFIRNLPFGVQIDSLMIGSSAISYQELPESGGIPGILFFDHLHGTIENLSTDSIGESVMHIKSRFMNAGDLTANFTFPLAKNKPYTVQGVLENFELTSINQLLVPLANLKVSSGQLQALKFSFQYDDHLATGNLDLRYADLKFKSLNSNAERSTNTFGTLLINTLVKNTMDKTDSKEQRSGKIHWKRDPNSSVLNYWWKSILSGIKSVFRLDKVLGLDNHKKAG